MKTLTVQAKEAFLKTGKEPQVILEEHKEMLDMLKMLHLSRPDNVLLRNLIKKVEQ